MSKSLFLVAILSFQFCKAPAQDEYPVLPGAYRTAEYLPLLEGKYVGLVVNHTSLIYSTHLVDTLISLGVQVTKVFTPEHGFKGSAPDGELVTYDSIATNYDLISLYGKTKKPTQGQMKGLDVVIFDIQDVGVRFYTYASTMTYMMEACADAGVEFLVLDRPNPNGSYVDGPMMKPESASFIGLHPVPVVHSLTLGELATMILGEGWFKTEKKLKLTVIPIANWTHKQPYYLPVKPSPNLPNDLAIALYPSLAFFEGTVVSVGRGTDFPFQVIGHPDFAGTYSFTPQPNEASKYPPLEGKKCFGDSFVGQPASYRLDLSHLIRYYHALKDELQEPFFGEYFYRWAGSPDLEQQIKDGLTEEEIRATWEADLEEYQKLRKKYLQYP